MRRGFCVRLGCLAPHVMLLRAVRAFVVLCVFRAPITRIERVESLWKSDVCAGALLGTFMVLLQRVRLFRVLVGCYLLARRVGPVASRDWRISTYLEHTDMCRVRTAHVRSSAAVCAPCMLDSVVD